jgi:polysaccharide export outer membrane protein
MTDHRTTLALRAAGLALCLAVGMGCAGLYDPVPPPPEGAYAAYRVGAPDQLNIVVLPEPVIERTVVVRPDGMISMDLIGDVPAGGRTVVEIAADIEKRLSRFKRDAAATVALASASSTAVTILGEVRRPESFPLVKQTRVAEAIGMVGDVTTFARTRKIRVIRSGGGETVVYIVNLSAIRGGDLRTNMLLRSGDIVYVEPNIFARVGYAINAVLFPFQPFMGIGAGLIASFALGQRRAGREVIATVRPVAVCHPLRVGLAALVVGRGIVMGAVAAHVQICAAGRADLAEPHAFAARELDFAAAREALHAASLRQADVGRNDPRS